MKNRILSALILIVLSGIILSSCTKKNPRVEIQTSAGNILIELYVEKAPVTAGNFLALAKRGLYADANFYRVVRGDNDKNPVAIQVLQGGLGDRELPADVKTIAHETTDKTGIKHEDMIVSMARSTPGSARSEFFICIGNQPELDVRGQRNPDRQGFAAFGKVVEGQEVVKNIWRSPAQGQNLTPPVKFFKVSVK